MYKHLFASIIVFVLIISLSSSNLVVLGSGGYWQSEMNDGSNYDPNAPADSGLSLRGTVILVALVGGFLYYLSTKNKKKTDEEIQNATNEKFERLESKLEELKQIRNIETNTKITDNSTKTVTSEDVYWDNIKKPDQNTLKFKGIDPYELLGVPENSTLTSISSKYHEISAQFNLDIAKDPHNQKALDEYRLKSIAYNEIMDEKDLSRKQRKQTNSKVEKKDYIPGVGEIVS